ncbi:hypothetical protein WKK05_39745 (plasmid) [Nostoc sp. UHCC 0302]|uniref:hypothetical protein n=1 Tax=Nostoc sp. UHCC 0302 TaxID=3134896 RepID=UPI00311CBC9F
MMKEWRERLFALPPSEFGLNVMGLPVSAAEGTRILGICYRTWKRWSELALYVPEYKQRYVEMVEKLASADETPPITRYQVWVIGKIGEVYSNLPYGITKKWIVQDYLSSNLSDFTLEEYQREQQFTQSQNIHREAVQQK